MPNIEELLNKFTPINPMQDVLERTQKENELVFRKIQMARDKKEAEELHRHNELIEALKSAGENGATIVVGDNANNIQIQQKSNLSSQEMVSSQTFDYDKALGVLKEIQEYLDYPQFEKTFKDNSETLKTIIIETINAVEEKREPSLIQKSFKVIKELAVGAGKSLIASGIVSLISMII